MPVVVVVFAMVVVVIIGVVVATSEIYRGDAASSNRSVSITHRV